MLPATQGLSDSPVLRSTPPVSLSQAARTALGTEGSYFPFLGLVFAASTAEDGTGRSPGRRLGIWPFRQGRPMDQKCDHGAGMTLALADLTAAYRTVPTSQPWFTAFGFSDALLSPPRYEAMGFVLIPSLRRGKVHGMRWMR